MAGVILQKLGGSGDQRKAVAEVRALLVGYRRQGGSLDRLFGPQKTCCLQGWSTHSTPECLEGEEQRLEPEGFSGLLNEVMTH